jgi:hypothetical protein
MDRTPLTLCAFVLTLGFRCVSAQGEACTTDADCLSEFASACTDSVCGRNPADMLCSLDQDECNICPQPAVRQICCGSYLGFTHRACYDCVNNALLTLAGTGVAEGCEAVVYQDGVIYTDAPTSSPTVAPTAAPTAIPTVATAAPTATPSLAPTSAPTANPTSAPTIMATNEPTIEPTNEPTIEPTAVPSLCPTTLPTDVDDTNAPSFRPTKAPTDLPTVLFNPLSDSCTPGQYLRSVDRRLEESAEVPHRRLEGSSSEMSQRRLDRNPEDMICRTDQAVCNVCPQAIVRGLCCGDYVGLNHTDCFDCVKNALDTLLEAATVIDCLLVPYYGGSPFVATDAPTLTPTAVPTEAPTDVPTAVPTTPPVVCENCPAGYYTNTFQSSTCLHCPYGRYQNEQGKSSCKSCGACPADQYRKWCGGATGMSWSTNGGADRAESLLDIAGGSSEGVCMACPQGYAKLEMVDVAWEAPCTRSGEGECVGPRFELQVFVDEVLENFDEVKHNSLTEMLAQYLAPPKIDLTSGVSCSALYLMSIQGADSTTYGMGCHQKFEYSFMVKHGGSAAVDEVFGVQIRGATGAASSPECPTTEQACETAPECQWGVILASDFQRRGVLVTYKVQTKVYDSGLASTRKLDLANAEDPSIGKTGLMLTEPTINSQYLQPDKIHIVSVRCYRISFCCSISVAEYTRHGMHDLPVPRYHLVPLSPPPSLSPRSSFSPPLVLTSFLPLAALTPPLPPLLPPRPSAVTHCLSLFPSPAADRHQPPPTCTYRGAPW